MKKRHLELFSGTHSFGKVSSKMGFEVVSLDRDIGAECPFGTGYESENHIKEDILNWNYKIYPPGYFYIITASPVCLWWSRLRFSNIGKRRLKIGFPLTREEIEEDILKFGVPMVDKLFEIIDYFNPKYFIIENPQSGRMKDYIPDIIPFSDFDYCQYGFKYRKRTRFWNNIGLDSKLCNKKKHIETVGGGNHRRNKKDNYRIPEKLIENFFNSIK